LILTLSTDLNAGSLIIFSFQLTNPIAQHNAASVIIAASGTIAIAPESFFSDVHSTLEPGTAAGDAAPLKVYQPFFIVAKIGQSCPYPSAQNVLSVTLAATILLKGQRDKFILLSGLRGSKTRDNVAMPISRPSSSPLSGTGLWVGDADNPIGGGGVLGIELGNNSVVEVGKILNFSFSLLNSDVEQPAKDITVTWTGNQGFIARIMTPDYSKLPLPGSTAGDAKPLKVQAPLFTVKSIRQSSTSPWGRNAIHVTLAANVLLNAKTRITIGGLVGSATGLSAQALFFPNLLSLFYSGNSPDVFGSTAYWERETGQLRLEVLGNKSLPAGQVCSFSFELRNPGTSNIESTDVYIRYLTR
jgi:hypothetical protein